MQNTSAKQIAKMTPAHKADGAIKENWLRIQREIRELNAYMAARDVPLEVKAELIRLHP